MESVLVQKPSKITNGIIKLEGSKSISNRVQIIRALTGKDFAIDNLSISDDSKNLATLLSQSGDTYDTGHAGTCYRFMTGYLSIQDGEQILTGSERMKGRPIGPLVDALRSLGAQIDYMENEGYPPLRIGSLDKSNYNKNISISGSVSSQYLSSLLMIAPVLPDGLQLQITDKLVSRPYLDMTLRIMERFGVKHSWINETTIDVPHQDYVAQDFTVESDWSAASYHYIIAAFSEEASITLEGLFEDSLQGDSAIVKIAESFGVRSTFKNDQLVLTKDASLKKDIFEYDFLQAPDLAQSVAVMAAGLGIYSVFTGLDTLKIKETDRITALRQELEKLQVFVSLLPAKFSPKSDVEYYAINGTVSAENPVEIETYKDHRMAMAFAPIAAIVPMRILKPKVVTKSYSNYWKDLETLGFTLDYQN